MNKLSLARQTQIIQCLVEGNSIRSTERMTDTHRDTVMRLMVQVGEGCQALHNEMVRDLPCKRIECDEIWSFVGKKQRWVKPGDDRARVGDQWTFVGIDAETKLVPAYLVSKHRNKQAATVFMTDLAGRLTNRVQLTTDQLNSYIEAVDTAFRGEVDYGQAVKFYEADTTPSGRYSPPRVVSAERHSVVGEPVTKHISTSLIERQNLTMRMSIRRFTRLTNAFSKKIENHKAAVALHFANYNLVRMHRAIRMTPAMAAGVVNRLWTLEELVERATLGYSREDRGVRFD
jgi:IS1 family transposase